MFSGSPHAPRIKRLVFQAVAKRVHPLSFLCFLVGFTWFLLWPILSHKTYFSENALGVGQHYSKFKLEDLKWADEQLRAFSSKSQLTVLTQVSKLLHSIGLETRMHHFRVERQYFNETRFVKGVNLYGTLRAQKGSGKESILLRVPFMNGKMDNLVMGLSLMRMFARQKWLHHDLIFVVADKRNRQWAGDEAFVTSKEIATGNIREAVILDFDRYDFDSISVLTEGINGELPNLDLVNTAIRLCQYQGFSEVSLFKNDFHQPEALPYPVYLYYRLLKYVQWQVRQISPEHNISDEFFVKSVTVVHNVYNQMIGIPTGAHAWYRKYSIHAITLTDTATGDGNDVGNRETNMFAIGKVCESVFRSMNNLIEELHQSFFIYFMDSVDTYYGFEHFLPNLLVLIGPLVLQFVGNYYLSEQEQLVHSLAYFVVTVLCGGVIYVLPYVLQQGLTQVLKVSIHAHSFFAIWLLAAFVVVLLLFTVLYPIVDRLYLALFLKDKRVVTVEWRTVKAFAMSYCCIILGVLFVLESASCIFASTYLYIVALIITNVNTGGQGMVTKCIQFILLLLTSPFTIVAALVAGHIYHNGFSLTAAINYYDQLLSRELLDIDSNVSFIILCILFIPVWLIAMKLVVASIQNRILVPKEKKD